MPGDSSAPAADFGRLDRPPALTARVEQLLRQAITEGRFPSGRLPTEAVLAEQLGVSRETVRLAAEALQREGLLVKIRRRGTFLRAPELPARVDAGPGLAAYLQAGYPAPQGPGEEAASSRVSALLLQGALEEASAHGLALVARHAAHTQLGKVFQELHQGLRLRGVIFASFGEEKLLRGVAGLGLPIVLVDHDAPLPQVHSVRDDSFAAARQAVLDLAARGHRRIALADWRHANLNPWRREGYRDGLRQAGLPRRRAWEIDVPLTPAGAAEAVRRLLALSPRPTALYCFNNSLARLILEALTGRLQVPADLSVVGGGGEEVPGLSCHQADWHQLGRQAVQVLLRALSKSTQLAGPLAGPPGGECEHLVLPHTPVAGTTVADGPG